MWNHNNNIMYNIILLGMLSIIVYNSNYYSSMNKPTVSYDIVKHE